LTSGILDLKKACEDILNLTIGNRPRYVKRRFAGLQTYFKSTYDPHKIKKVARALLKRLVTNKNGQQSR